MIHDLEYEPSELESGFGEEFEFDAGEFEADAEFEKAALRKLFPPDDRWPVTDSTKSSYGSSGRARLNFRTTLA